LAQGFSGGRVDDANIEVVDEHDDVGSGVASMELAVLEGRWAIVSALFFGVSDVGYGTFCCWGGALLLLDGDVG
jgi:hypothetical protein